MFFRPRNAAQREQLVGVIAVVVTFLLVLGCMLAFGEDLRLERGCHPVFGCEEGVEMPNDSLSPTPTPPKSPLFTQEIVAKDTPPEMLSLLNSRTWENAEAYVAMERERYQATKEAQQMIDTVKARRKQP